MKGPTTYELLYALADHLGVDLDVLAITCTTEWRDRNLVTFEAVELDTEMGELLEAASHGDLPAPSTARERTIRRLLAAEVQERTHAH